MLWWRRARWTVSPLLCLSFLSSPAAANPHQQNASLGSAEIAQYSVRIRIQNTVLGAVEATADGGRQWHLIGRTMAPAVEAGDAAATNTAPITRGQGNTLIIAIPTRRAVTIMPHKSSSVPRNVLSLEPDAAFSLLIELLSLGTPTMWLETPPRPCPLYEGFAPSDGDVFVIGFALGSTDASRVAKLVSETAAYYDTAARKRYTAAGKSPVTGYVTVIARLPQVEQGGPVLFLLDGSPVALINRAPYTVRWDSRDWRDGEHMIEVRSLDRGGNPISSAKTLIYVENRGRGG